MSEDFKALLSHARDLVTAGLNKRKAETKELLVYMDGLVDKLGPGVNKDARDIVMRSLKREMRSRVRQARSETATAINEALADAAHTLIKAAVGLLG